MSSVYVSTPLPTLSTDMSFILARAPLPVISGQMEFTRDVLESWKRENAVHGERIQRKSQRHGHTAGDDNTAETLSNDDVNDVGDQSKIPKPIGEPGRRPETGGFPLKERLLKVEMWEEETYDNILVRDWITFHTLTHIITRALSGRQLRSLSIYLSASSFKRKLKLI